MERGTKRAIEIAHRRWGKDEICLHKAAVSAFERPATYWHMLPEYAQGRKAIWTAVNPHTGKRRIDEAFPRELRDSTQEQEMFIRFKSGATWQVLGSDRYDAAVGSPPAGVVFSEWSRANPAAWAYLSPILVENSGWAAFITTPLGRNHAHSMLEMARKSKDWFSEVSTIKDTGILSMEVIEEQRKEYHALYGQEDGDALIEQEYYCSFDAAILGAYYAKIIAQLEADGRINPNVKWEPELPVHTSWDLGIRESDTTALWFFQVHYGELRVIECYENFNMGLDHYAKVKLDRPYKYEIDWVPHDARVRELGTGRSRVETMISLGLNPRVVPDHGRMDGINAVRVTLPLCWFNSEKCGAGISALRAYHREYDEEARVFKTTPFHGWESNYSDSFRYLCMAWREIVPEARVKTIEQRLIEETAQIAKAIAHKPSINEMLEELGNE